MAINGSVTWGIMPIWHTGGTGIYAAMNVMQYGSGGNYLVSANDPIRYQVIWSGSGITENYQPTAEDDIVNIIFRVYVSTSWPPPSLADMELIGTIRKSRDVPNRNVINNTTDDAHRFTIDIAPLLADQLSYSLTPLGKGTQQTAKWGGMNGGVTMQDNVTVALGKYAQTLNGTYRVVKVNAEAEVIQSDGTIQEENISLGNPPALTVINSVNQFDKDNTYYNQTFRIQKWGSTSTSPKRIMSNCPNWSSGGALATEFKKPVRPETEVSSEWVYFFLSECFDGNFPNDYYNLYEVYGTAYDKDGNSLTNPFVLTDFNSCLRNYSSTKFDQMQNRVLAQNISPYWIKNNAYEPQDGSRPYTTAYTWDSDTAYYRLYLSGNYNQDVGPGACGCWTRNRHSALYFYEIDREEACGGFEFVRFHWLNTAGGIDSYTAKRNIPEGLSITKETADRKSGDRMHFQENRYDGSTLIPDDDYWSDSMRGGNVYKGGREVINTHAQKNNSVYTEPLNNTVAKWLSEIATSPNVWIETPSDKDADAAYMWNYFNGVLRPEPTMYTPVIITNTDVQTVSQEEGLVKFNIQYTHSHKIQTQRN